MKLKGILFLILTTGVVQLSAQVNIDTSDIALHLAHRYQNVLNALDDAVVEGKIKGYETEDLARSYDKDSILSLPHYTFEIQLNEGKPNSGVASHVEVVDDVKSNRRNFHKGLIVYQQEMDKKGVRLNFKALGMGEIKQESKGDMAYIKPMAEYYVNPSDIEKVLNEADYKFLLLVLQHGLKYQNESAGNGRIISTIYYGHIDFRLMAKIAFTVESDMRAVFDSMQAHQSLPKTFVTYKGNAFSEDSFTFVLGERTNAMLNRNKDNRNAKIEAMPRLLRFKKSKEVIAVGWKLEGKLIYPQRKSVVIFPMEEGHFITKKEILQFVPKAKLWFNAIF